MVVMKETNITVTNTKDIAKIFQDLLALEDELDQDQEHVYVLHVDARNTVKMVELVSLGTVNAALLHPREIYRRAVKEASVGIIVAHNHPSGNVEPSADDVATTKQLIHAGGILDIRLLDHIIFTKDTYFSFQDHG